MEAYLCCHETIDKEVCRQPVMEIIRHDVDMTTSNQIAQYSMCGQRRRLNIF